MRTRQGRRVCFLRGGRHLLIAAASLLAAQSSFAQPTQEQFFQSMRQSVQGPPDGTGRFFLILLGCITIVILLVWLGQGIASRQVRPRVLNSPRRLVKEARRALPLRSGEWKLARTLADEQNIVSPLALLLCPSLLRSASRANGTRTSPKAADRLVRKLLG